MSSVRDLIYAFVNRRGDDMARYGPPRPYQQMIEADSDDDLYLRGLLNRVEEDAVHAAAQKLLDMHADVLLKHGPAVAQGLAKAIATIDPYVVRDEQLVHKADGKPVSL